MIKYEKNPSLKQVYIDKMKDQLDRAEYIKKTALSKPENQIVPTEDPSGGNESGGASATAKKPAKKK